MIIQKNKNVPNHQPVKVLAQFSTYVLPGGIKPFLGLTSSHALGVLVQGIEHLLAIGLGYSQAHQDSWIRLAIHKNTLW